MQVYSGGPSPDFYYIYYIDGDTTLSGNIYNKLYFDQYPQTSFRCYQGAYRSDTIGRLYYVPTTSNLEYRLFDFSKNSGDTINNIPLFLGYCDTDPISSYDVTVDSVTNVIRGSRVFKKIFFGSSIFGESLIWMEGVGSPNSGFFPLYTANTGTYCMSHSDTIFYRGIYWVNYDYDYSVGHCDSITTNYAVNYPVKDEIKIYPVIFSNTINISYSFFKNSSINLNIINPLGEIVTSTMINSPLFTVDLSALNAGLYFLIIKNGGDVLKIQKIMKEVSE